VDVEIYQWEKRMEEAAKRAKEAEVSRQTQEAEARRKIAEQEAKDAYTLRVKQIKEELDLEKSRLNQIIANIDAELDARDRLKDEEDYEKRVARLKLDIEFERNAENRIALEKELLRLQKDREEELYREGKQAEKDAVQAQIDAAETLADSQIAAAEKTRDALLSQYEQLYTVMVEQLTGTTAKSPLTAVQEAYDAARRAIEQTVTNTVNTTNTYSAPITIANAWTPEMLHALVRNSLERLMMNG
jgi:hypothetical protein